MTRTTMLRLSALVAVGVLAAGCAGSSADPLEAEPVATSEISVVDNEFDPVAAEVPVGTEVTWTWEGSADHNVVADDESFESEVQSEGTFSQTFDEAGSFTYQCTIHPGMNGAVIVTES